MMSTMRNPPKKLGYDLLMPPKEDDFLKKKIELQADTLKQRFAKAIKMKAQGYLEKMMADEAQVKTTESDIHDDTKSSVDSDSENKSGLSPVSLAKKKLLTNTVKLIKYLNPDSHYNQI